MTDLEDMLTSLQAQVDRLGAEIKDPITTQERKDEIFTVLEMLYESLLDLQQVAEEREGDESE